VVDLKARAPVVVIGVGNSLRGDDAAGLETVRSLHERAARAGVAVMEQEGETLGLIEQWEGARAVVLVDAIHSGSPPGTIHRLDASSTALPAPLQSSSSTHAVSIGEAIELARSLERLPRRLVLYGVEGRSFGAGAGLSDEVRTAIPALAAAVLSEARKLTCLPPDRG
jgi:hydrogenase maturation protease